VTDPSIPRDAVEAARVAVRDALYENKALTFVGLTFCEREVDRTKAINQITEACLSAAIPHLRAKVADGAAEESREAHFDQEVVWRHFAALDIAVAIRARKP
jgi:hypothetical protein